MRELAIQVGCSPEEMDLVDHILENGDELDRLWLLLTLHRMNSVPLTE